ncbi:protein translocase subunit SecF [Cognatilysobacter lacus]|uniref:Protein-export membrane protein SecF n=1 Tax=Cognatilysobacter lacus TaxID=1643323 RepID=A0A5D8Z7S2_9GAMM|nr:protein translocase subunit SecF [Lysobacter lacus]TZF90133.1 protein translocase subunit SecF [Lysobacter lacus]
MKPFNVFPYDSNIDFMRLRWVSLTIAGMLMLTSFGAMLFHAFNGGFDPGRTFNFALDFTGGSVVELRFDRPVDTDNVRSRLDTAGFRGAQVQALGSGREIMVRLQPQKTGTGTAAKDQTAAAVVAAVAQPGNAAHVQRSDFVGPQVGKELAWKSLYAFLFVLVGLLLYISMRFELKFAIGAIIATIHDVSIVAGWFAITRHEFDLTVLAGLLAVMGFSINDTIVVFDRVRENFRSMRLTPREIMNKAVNQTLSRTVIVSFVAFLSMLALYVFGGASLRGLAEAQIIGTVIGTLSSIFIACPLLLWQGVSKQDLMPKARDEAALARRP